MTTADLEVVQAAATAAWSKGASDPVALDVSERFALSDTFLILAGRNERNTKAIADEIEEVLLARSVKLLRREGKADGRWILLDFGSLVVHVFQEDERHFYALERLWKDCPVIPLALPDAQSAEDRWSGRGASQE